MWVYIWVVDMSLWPSKACTNLKSAPPSNKWVAKECLSLCGETDFFNHET